MTNEDTNTFPPVPALRGAAPRCVIVVDADLPPGLAANAAAVLALSLGGRVQELLGVDMLDGDGEVHVGLIPRGLPVLAASRTDVARLRQAAVGAGVCLVDLPAAHRRPCSSPRPVPSVAGCGRGVLPAGTGASGLRRRCAHRGVRPTVLRNRP